jgi:hypothetical protein
MNRNHQILFNVFLFTMGSIICYGQEKSKTYKETFNVGKDAVLNIDTSHADIEFETWDKNQVEITATVELEEATDEEAKSYFEKDAIKIVGNSKEITVSTAGVNFGNSFDFRDLDIVIPDVSFVEPLFESLRIPELPELEAVPRVPEVFVIPELPPMPPIPFVQFDYDKYKKDGDKYLKEWKKDFDKNFDKEYKDRFEEWSEEVEQRAEEREREIQERQEERQKLLEERNALRKEARAVRNEARIQRDEARAVRNEARHEARSERSFTITRDSDSDTFYFSSDGENKKYKVKKSIKIKMPKSVKLKMNVRHGEVKLAANTKNINASLSYASLHASTIDGDRTDIRASYSPVVVQKWNLGQLKTDYSDLVNLKEVNELKLNAISSNIVIDHLEGKVFVTNNLGDLNINSISDNFSIIDITVENGEVNCKIPSTPFSVYVNEIASEFKYPKVLAIGSSDHYGAIVHKGYHINNKQGKSIKINSKYSEVVLQE